MNIGRPISRAAWGLVSALPGSLLPSIYGLFYKKSATDASGWQLISTADETVGHQPRGGIVCTGASIPGLTVHNSGLLFGTGDFTIGQWVRLADWTPGATVYLSSKGGGSGTGNGWWWQINTNGTMAFRINGASNGNPTSTAAISATDGAWAFLAVRLDRDGNLTYFVNGQPLGIPISIAANAADSLTDTVRSLAWGSDGATHLTGTLGECWIVNGLVTDAQMALIYSAGSIAPFAASFTFYTRPNFAKGNGIIAEDLSGNNQHAILGTSGLTHAVPTSSRGNPSRAPMKALVSDGRSNALLRATLNSQDPTTGELVLWWDGVMPTDNTTAKALAVLTSGTTEFVQISAFALFYDTVGINVRLYGTGTGFSRSLFSLALFTLLAGKRCVIAVRKSAAGVRVFLGYDGEFLDITNLMAETTGGASPPAWTDAVDGDYLTAFYRNVSASGAFTLYDLRLANYAMTEADLRAEYERGEPHIQWMSATRTNRVQDNSFEGVTPGVVSSGADIGTTGFRAWGTGGANGQVEVVDDAGNGASGSNRYLRMTIGADSYIYGLSIGVASRAHRVTFWARKDPGSAGNPSIVMQGLSPTVNLREVGTTGAGTTAISLTDTTWRQYETVEPCLIVSGGTRIDIRLQGTAGHMADVDIISVYPIGYTVRLSTEKAAGFTALNESHHASNDSTDFVSSTDGVTTIPLNRSAIIRGMTNTNGNQLLLGATSAKANMQWLRVRARSRSGTPSITIGNAPGDASYVASVALSTTWKILTIALSGGIYTAGNSNIYIGSNSTDAVEVEIIGELPLY